MKLDNIPDSILTKDQISKVQKLQTELTLVDKVKKIPGHQLFELNVDNGELVTADVKTEVRLGTNLLPVYSNSIVIKPRCIYVQALNKKNAEKKILKMISKIKENGNYKS